MIAAARSTTALLTQMWQQAENVRREWLEVGLSTEPADRSTTEEILAAVYARHRRGRPVFRWVDSPHAALPLLRGLPTHASLMSLVRAPVVGKAPLASDIAAGLSRLRSDLDDRVLDPPLDRPPFKREKNQPWPSLPPLEALRVRVPFLEIVRQGVRDGLWRSLGRGTYLPVRGALGAPVPVGWYGNQDASWIAYFEALRAMGLAQYPASFDRWVALTRAAGWWWPGERECVLVERPVELRVSPVPGGLHGEVALDRVVYRDGWSV
ncbi:DUF6745 domain-containing protein [Actinoplanes sp. NPDC051411]|uniref:DUF6745 domain-containing protein n=1 Tax=Actinoplanes sp. NPDC051411 TaxID=3155522 RepID=UPI003425CF17